MILNNQSEVWYIVIYSEYLEHIFWVITTHFLSVAYEIIVSLTQAEILLAYNYR